MILDATKFTWENGVKDPTGYLHTFVKSLGLVLKNSPFAARAEDAVAESGFAFRLWVDGKGLCPSSTSIWDFDLQRSGVENAGLTCRYTSRLWGEDDLEAERRQQAIDSIRQGIDGGIASTAWDVDGCEWGVIYGYDDGKETLCCLSAAGAQVSLPYRQLGQRELPILSVLTVTGENGRTEQERVRETMAIAVRHARGEEWCDNPQGLAAYPALIDYAENGREEELNSFNMAYMLGTYAALRYHAWQYWQRRGDAVLAADYRAVFENWQAAFDAGRSAVPGLAGILHSHLTAACEAESHAVSVMESRL